MGVGQPGMHRPHRHLDRERGKERQPQPRLQGGREIMLQERRHVGGAGLEDHGEDGEQHQNRYCLVQVCLTLKRLHSCS